MWGRPTHPSSPSRLRRIGNHPSRSEQDVAVIADLSQWRPRFRFHRRLSAFICGYMCSFSGFVPAVWRDQTGAYSAAGNCGRMPDGDDGLIQRVALPANAKARSAERRSMKSRRSSLLLNIGDRSMPSLWRDGTLRGHQCVTSLA